MRKTSEVRIPAVEGNRDSGKLFVVTEMPALQGFKWGVDALRALARAGAEVLPDDIKSPNMALLAGLGFRALSMADGAEVDSLMDRLATCATYYPDSSRREVSRPVTGLPPFENDVEEVSTHFLLRKEAFDLSIGFLLGAMTSKASADSTTAPSP